MELLDPIVLVPPDSMDCPHAEVPVGDRTAYQLVATNW